MRSCLSIFKRTKTITQHLSYDNMGKSTSSTMKAANTAKKKTGQWHRSPKFYGIVLFLLAAWVFPLPAPLFYHFFDKQRCHNARLHRMIGSCFLMSFSFSVHKKREYCHPSQYCLVPPRLRWRRQARHPQKPQCHRCCHCWLWNWPDNYFLGCPILFAKLPAYCINWLSIDNIRCKLKKYSNEDETGKKIEEGLSSLLSNFSTSELRFTLVATLAKWELDIKDLPLRKNKLIELFSQLIFDDMSTLGNLTKTAKRYMLYIFSWLE